MVVIITNSTCRGLKLLCSLTTSEPTASKRKGTSLICPTFVVKHDIYDVLVGLSLVGARSTDGKAEEAAKAALPEQAAKVSPEGGGGRRNHCQGQSPQMQVAHTNIYALENIDRLGILRIVWVFEGSFGYLYEHERSLPLVTKWYTLARSMVYRHFVTTEYSRPVV